MKRGRVEKDVRKERTTLTDDFKGEECGEGKNGVTLGKIRVVGLTGKFLSSVYGP